MKKQEEDENYLNGFKKFVIAKTIYKVYKEENELILTNLKIKIPMFHVNIMADMYNVQKHKAISKYGIYRSYENYLTKTSWYKNLDSNLQTLIYIDFYKTIILGINNSLKLASRFHKKG